jgi:nitroreductase
MTPGTFAIPLSTEHAKWAVEQACLAPSLHNTQPWRFTWDGSTFELFADMARGLTASDPDGRELVISCGAALFNLRVALRKIGYDYRLEVLPDRDNPRLLARVTVEESTPADPDERRTFAAMGRRHTHRAAFDDVVLEPQIAVYLQRAAELEGAQLIFVADPGQRRRVLSLARAAERALAHDLDVQAELNDWTPTPGSRRADGVPVTAYATDPVVGVDELAPRDFDRGRGLGLADNVVSTPGLVAVLVSDGDLQDDWLAAGQALEHVLVRAALHGVYAALHSQATEVPSIRSELRRELCVPGYPQILLRFGYSDDVRHTPRRRVDDVLQLP